ncbi:MAG: glycosyltransferase family 2 protein [Xanthomonadales bacterium]|nr:glycosyltransferase family 2 protein [Xanthomonadales bacterium]
MREDSLDRQASIGVAIANYNKAPYLAQCLASVLTQNHGALEVVLVDDASTDESLDIAGTYAEQHPNLRVIELDRNRGVAHARNTAIESLDCDWVATLDSDDFLADPDKLRTELVAAQAQGEPRVAAYSGIISVDRKGRRMRRFGRRPPVEQGWLFEALLSRTCLVPRDFLFPREMFEVVGHYDSALPVYEDWDWKLRFARHAPFVFTGKAGVAYRETESGLSALLIDQNAATLWKVFERHASYAADPARARLQLQRSIRPAWPARAWRALLGTKLVTAAPAPG